MTRFLPLLAALLFAGAATAQDTDTPAETAPMEASMEAAADTSESAITFDPERARTLAAEGDELLRNRDFDGAMEQYTLGFAYDSTYAKNPFGQARAHKGLRQLEDAIAAYRLALDLSTDDEGTPVEGMTNIATAAETELAELEEVIAQRQSAQAIASKIQRATTMLQSEPVSENAAQTAYGLLEEARMADYDSSQVAFYYAKALNVLGRTDEAVHYANLAVEQSEGQADRSAFFIQLGLAQMNAGNTGEAREAFEATQGGAWEAWGTHYLSQLDEQEGGGDEAGG
jgi:tetratricopeptide (TPR) repeat protein